MTQIQPVTVPTKGTGIYFNLLALNFPMDPSSVSFYWSVLTEVLNEEEESSPGQVILDGNITMDEETYAGWGTDDNYAIDWALDELGFTRA
jgi:hypothetical protein